MTRERRWPGRDQAGMAASGGLFVLLVGLAIGCADGAAPTTGTGIAEAAITERFDFGAVVVEVATTSGATHAVLKSAVTSEAFVVLDVDHVASRGTYTITGAGELNVTGQSAGVLTEAELSTSPLEAAQRAYALWQGSIDFLGQGGAR